VGSSASPENWIAYTSANGWLLAPPAAARDEQAFELYNDKASMLPALPMLCPMSRDAMATRRDGHRAGYAAAWRWAKTGQFDASVQYSCFLDIVEEGSGQLIGTTGFRVIEQVSGEISAEWGIIVAAGWRRRHVCSESFNALLPLARSLWGCTKITANTLDSNSSMVAFLETRAGMQRTGHVHGNWVEFQRNTPDVHECATGDTNELQGQFGRSFQVWVFVLCWLKSRTPLLCSTVTLDPGLGCHVRRGCSAVVVGDKLRAIVGVVAGKHNGQSPQNTIIIISTPHCSGAELWAGSHGGGAWLI